MNIAYTKMTKSEDLDLILAEVATKLKMDGLNLCGVVQVNSDRDDCHRCDMDVQILPDGPEIRISQSLGKDAQGCRLDPDALERAVVEVTDRLSRDTDVLILNKFGKHEAEGRGFRELIAKAVELDVLVMTGVNAMNQDAFLTFSEDMATLLPSDPNAMIKWVNECLSQH
jgi:nucleoside-triphosphatase THEP1